MSNLLVPLLHGLFACNVGRYLPYICNGQTGKMTLGKPKYLEDRLANVDKCSLIIFVL